MWGIKMNDLAAPGKGPDLPGLCKGFLVLTVYLAALACDAAAAKTKSPWAGYTQVGKASYYAAKFQSRKTASGELYDQAKKTAAHRKLPFGTKIRVTNTKNRKSVTVRVNDRGPFVKGRIVDLSASAFTGIADMNAGVIDVEIEVIE